MRISQSYIKTLKEVPNDAEIASHQLMLRAGMIRKLASGLYTWLPLGLRVLRRVERIVREEMNRAGALEILMPAIQPAELWQETGRWETFGNQLLTMTDNNQRAYCFGPTHEEVVTDLIRQEIQSYKELPLTVYQIQTKFRDEIRPRFGVMRAREFIMKDAYSFHTSTDSLQQTYQHMYAAYCRIFDRMGLEYRAVEADTGAIGGAVSHEFQVLADAGEDMIFYSDASTYAANVEQAKSLAPNPAVCSPSHSLEKIDNPNIRTLNELAHSLGLSNAHMVKIILVAGKQQPWVALALRANDELNLVKAAKHPWIKSPICLATETDLQSLGWTNAASLGPVDLNLPLIVDQQAAAVPVFACGAGTKGVYYRNAQWSPTQLEETADLRSVQIGDPSPDGQGYLQVCRGIEVGHIFQLGDKYAKAMHLDVSDETGIQKTLIMGCYGLGISRVVAAAIEQHHDERGICWPEALAPFQLLIVPINQHRSEQVKNEAECIYQRCLDLNIDVLLDDRDEHPGVLFADADLLGIPHRLVISERQLKQQQVEYKQRSQNTAQNIPLAELETWLQTMFR